MPIQVINTGAAPNDGTGDPARAAFTKVNENFQALDGEMYRVKALYQSAVPPVDFNTLTAPGTYEFLTVAINAAVNKPAGAAAGLLEVLPTGANTAQRFTEFVSRRVYVRGYAFGAWSPWAEIPALDASRRLPYGVALLGNETYAGAPKLPLRTEYGPTVGAGSTLYALPAMLNCGTISVSASTRYLRIYPENPFAATSMAAMRIFGFCNAGGRLIDVTVAFMPNSGGFSSPSLTVRHNGPQQPPTGFGVDAAGRQYVVIDRNGLSWTALVVETGVLAHGGARPEVVDSYRVNYTADTADLTMTWPTDSGLDASIAALSASVASTYAPLANPTLAGATIDGTFRQVDGADPMFIRHGSSSSALKAIALRRGRGTINSPLPLLTNDRIAGFFYSAYSGSAYENFFSMEATASGDWSSGVCPSRVMFQKMATSGGRANVLSFEPNNTIIGYEDARFQKALSAGGALTVGAGATITGPASVGGALTVAGATFLGQFTQATLPTASANAGATAWCVDTASGAAMVECDGTEWLVCKTGLPVGLAPYEYQETGGGQTQYSVRRTGSGDMVLTCTHIRGSAAEIGTHSWSFTFPWAFVAGTRPSVQATVRSGNSGDVVMGVEGVGPALASGFFFNRSNGPIANVQYMITATGRWK